MTRTGLFGVFMISAAIVIAAFVLTGPRAAYWQAVLGLSGYQDILDNPAVQLQVRENKRLKRLEFNGVAEMRLDTDRTQVLFSVTKTAETPPEAVQLVAEHRDLIRNTLAENGFDRIVFNELGLETGETTRDKPSKSNRFRDDPAKRLGPYFAQMRLAITFEQPVDLLSVLAGSEFDSATQIEKPLFWNSNLDAAMIDIEEAVLENARARARRVLGDRPFSETSVRFQDELKNRTQKFSVSTPRVAVKATLQILTEEEEPDVVDGLSSPVSVHVGSAPILNSGKKPDPSEAER